MTATFLKFGKLLLWSFLLFSAQSAFANCMLNGKEVPEGTLVGNLVGTNVEWVQT